MHAQAASRSPAIIAAAESSTAAALSETFESRVDLGKASEQKPEFVGYHNRIDRELGEQYAATIRSCLTGTKNPQIDTFTLVADIAADGKVNAVAVRPATNIASCFADGLKGIAFPAPPPYPARSGFPITIRMTITE